MFALKISVQTCRTAFVIGITSLLFGAVALHAQSAPFSGQPAPIPGIIQAVNYDLGGQGVAFNYTPPSGCAVTNYYRSDPVGMQTNNAGGNTLAYITAGEWLSYTVNPPSSFVAQVRYNVAQDPGSAAIYALRLSVDGRRRWTCKTTTAAAADGASRTSTPHCPSRFPPARTSYASTSFLEIST